LGNLFWLPIFFCPPIANLGFSIDRKNPNEGFVSKTRARRYGHRGSPRYWCQCRYYSISLLWFVIMQLLFF